MRVGAVSVTLLTAALALSALGFSASPSDAAAHAKSSQAPPGYLANSTQAVCRLTGEHGRYQEQPTNYTAIKYGLSAGDSGSSFVDGDTVWWLFGNTSPTANNPWTPTNQSSRWPYFTGTFDSAAGQGSDSIATSPASTLAPAPVAPYNNTVPPPNQQCPALTFVTQTSTTGQKTAFVNPSVFPDPMFKTADYYVSLRRGELPEAGIALDGNVYVVFGTDNPANCLSPAATTQGPCVSPGINKFSKSCSGTQKGSRTRSVMAEYQSNGEFKGLYDLSAPSSRYAPLCPEAPSTDDARFVNVQMQNGNDGFIYIWGTEGGANNNVSPIYLARIPVAQIATGSGIEYWNGQKFKAGPAPDPESIAKPLFNDQPDPCAAQLGIQYNQYLREWIMLYRCNETSAPTGHPNGIYMRTAAHPWGHWSSPTTIFDPTPDASTDSGECYFIYHAGKCPTGSLNATLSNVKTPQDGGDYGPYLVDNWTTGTAKNPVEATVRVSTTIYYTLDTFDPYGQLIMRSTILGPRTLNVKLP